MQSKKALNFRALLHWPELPDSWRAWLPSRGTVLFVTVVVAALFYTGSVGAFPLRAPSAPSTSIMSYQGHLADSGGNPLTEGVDMEFRVYDVPTGGAPLWTEIWTGGDEVEVSDGLFNVMLGSINNTLAESVEGHDELYLGITVNTDSEMEPRVQLGSVPFSMQAMTVPDGSITMEKIASGAVIQHQAVSGTMMASTSSTSFVDLPDRSVTLTTSGGSVLVMFSGSHKASNVYMTGYWRIVRDGSVVVAYNNHGFSPLEWTTTTLIGVDTPPAGQHTYKVQWRVNQETLTASETAYTENLVAVEFKR